MRRYIQRQMTWGLIAAYVMAYLDPGSLLPQCR